MFTMHWIYATCDQPRLRVFDEIEQTRVCVAMRALFKETNSLNGVVVMNVVYANTLCVQVPLHL